MFRGFGVASDRGAKGVVRRGAESDGRAYALGIRPFEEWARASGRCPGGQAKMREGLGDHGRMFDGGYDLR